MSSKTNTSTKRAILALFSYAVIAAAYLGIAKTYGVQLAFLLVVIHWGASLTWGLESD